MTDTNFVVEAHMLIPVRGDKALCNGELHSMGTWKRFRAELYQRYGGYTLAPGFYHGTWRDRDTGSPVSDQNRQYIVALPMNDVSELRRVLSIAAVLFHQKCIYLSLAGRVELVEAYHDIDHDTLSRFGRSGD